MKKIVYITAILLAASCSKQSEFDAQGTFEATEIVISSEANGKILNFDIDEGEYIDVGTAICTIDSTQLHLQRKQLTAQQAALLDSRPDINKQASSLRNQISTQRKELNRIENLLKDGAATQKQYDDIDAQIKILESQLEATLSTLNKSTTSISNNSIALDAQIDALSDLIAKCKVTSPVKGSVLVKYAEAGELSSAGKPLVKIADLDNI